MNSTDNSSFRSRRISQYIKELQMNIRTTHFFKVRPSRKKSRHSPFNPVKHRPKSLHTALSELSSDSEAQDLLKTFAAPLDLSGRLPSLQKLIIMAGESASQLRSYHHFLSIFKTPAQHALQSIAGTVRVITMSIPLEFYRDGIFLCNVSLPLLEEFNVGLYAVYLTTDYENVFETCVVPFVNRHSQSLTKLSFSVFNMRHTHPQYLYDFRTLFRGLSHIPGLSSFAFEWYILPSAEAGLDELGRFIQTHSATLSAVQLNIYHPAPFENSVCLAEHMPGRFTFSKVSRFYTPSTLFCHQLLTQALPSCSLLRTFQFKLLGKDSFQTDPAPFLQWFPTFKSAETLTSLQLIDNWFNQADLAQLISSVDLSSLRKLWVRSHPLSMALFDVFAEKLRGLQLLKLRISGVASRKNPSEISVSQSNILVHTALTAPLG